MTISLSVPELTELRPRITVFGVGGAGGNAVSNMIQSELDGVEFVVANTDAQALTQSKCERRIQMGVSITEGLGAGSRPEVGRAAAEESIDEILDHLSGCHMVFITAGMGGGTGTGAAPVIAQAAREQGILTVGVVTKPFQFEGNRRMRIAELGIEEFQRYADTLLIIPNQNLFRIANENTTFADAFTMADDVLHSGVRGITDLMVMPGLINLDFADVRAVMNEMGKAMMGTGEASGEKRAVEAAEAAIANPLLDDVSMKGARGVLINITGGPDLGLYEVDEAANRIRSEVDADANIIVGSTFCDRLEGAMRVSVVATGIDVAEGIEDDDQSSSSERNNDWQTAGGNSASGNPNNDTGRPPVHVMTDTIEKRFGASNKSTAPSSSLASSVPTTNAASATGKSEGETGTAEVKSGASQADGKTIEAKDAEQTVSSEAKPQARASISGGNSFTNVASNRGAVNQSVAVKSELLENKQNAQPTEEVRVQSVSVNAAQDLTAVARNSSAAANPEISQGSSVPQTNVQVGNAPSGEAATQSAASPELEPTQRKRGSMTVFEKMMEGVRTARNSGRSTSSVKRGIAPSNVTTDDRYTEQAENSNEPDLQNDHQDDAVFNPNDQEEQLEIPAFLRR